jgi:hypothetical protein
MEKISEPLDVISNSLGPDLQLDEITGKFIHILSAITFGKPSYIEDKINKSFFL